MADIIKKDLVVPEGCIYQKIYVVTEGKKVAIGLVYSDKCPKHKRLVKKG